MTAFILALTATYAKFWIKLLSHQMRWIFFNYFDFWDFWKLQEDFFERLKIEIDRTTVIDRSSYEDINLCEDLTNKSFDEKYVDMLEKRQKLPAFQRRNDIIAAVRDNQVVLIEGSTGCGKTTQVRS